MSLQIVMKQWRNRSGVESPGHVWWRIGDIDYHNGLTFPNKERIQELWQNTVGSEQVLVVESITSNHMMIQAPCSVRSGQLAAFLAALTPEIGPGER